jgi:LPS-assembly lipoprotein
MKSITRTTLTLLATIAMTTAITACGFHLRNDASLPTSLQPIFIGGSAGNGALAQVLRYQLTNSNTKVTPRSAEANYQVILHGVSQSQRIISLDRRGLAAEYGISASVEFELHDKQGQRVLGPQKIEERRTVTNNPDNALTTSQDVALISADMNQVLAAQIVRRLGAYANHRPPVAAPTESPATSSTQEPSASIPSTQPAN